MTISWQKRFEKEPLTISFYTTFLRPWKIPYWLLNTFKLFRRSLNFFPSTHIHSGLRKTKKLNKHKINIHLPFLYFCIYLNLNLFVEAVIFFVFVFYIYLSKNTKSKKNSYLKSQWWNTFHHSIKFLLGKVSCSVPLLSKKSLLAEHIRWSIFIFF